MYTFLSNIFEYNVKVSAALRPAFSEDTPSHVTAAACRVCGTWIGSGVAKDLNDLKRVYHLLVTSLRKLKPGFSINFNSLYNESVATFECLAILKAWAQVINIFIFWFNIEFCLNINNIINII